jgi:hypothetical protein
MTPGNEKSEVKGGEKVAKKVQTTQYTIGKKSIDDEIGEAALAFYSKYRLWPKTVTGNPADVPARLDNQGMAFSDTGWTVRIDATVAQGTLVASL